MKNVFTLMLVLALPLFAVNMANAQCVPDEINCIDTGDPGQMCPDTLAEGMVNVPYTQVVTVLPPPTFDYNGNTVNLSHIKILNVLNLPPGLTYESNAANNLFASGTYYCILISGTPVTAGTFALKIEVQPYIASFPIPTSVIDSTSLFITVQPESNAISYQEKLTFSVKAVYPNPFDEASEIICTLPQPGEVSLSIRDGLGREIYREQKYLPQGKNSFQINGEDIMPGIYYYSLTFRGQSENGMIMKM